MLVVFDNKKQFNFALRDEIFVQDFLFGFSA